MLAFAFAGSAALDRDLMNAVGSVPHDRRRVWRTVIVPASLGWITAGLRAALAAALVGAFVGQIISSSEGLGHRIQRALGLFDIDGVWVGIIGFACVGLVLSYAIQWGMAILMRHYRHRFGHHQPSGGRTP